MQQPQAEFSEKPPTNLNCEGMGTFSKSLTSPSMALGKGKKFSALSTVINKDLRWRGNGPQMDLGALILTEHRVSAKESPQEVLCSGVCLCTICQLPNFPGSQNWGNKARLRGVTGDQGLDFLLSPWEYKPSSYSVFYCAPTLRQQVSLGCFSKLVSCSKGPIKLTPVSLHVLLFLLMGFPGFLISVQPLTTLLGNHTLVRTSIFWFLVMVPLPWVMCPQSVSRYLIFQFPFPGHHQTFPAACPAVAAFVVPWVSRIEELNPPQTPQQLL